MDLEKQIKDTEAKGGKPFSQWYFMPATAFLLGLSTISMFLWSNGMNERHRANFSFANDLLEMQVETAAAHLWMEEAMRDASEMKKELAKTHLADALRLAQEIGQGEKNSHGPIPHAHRLLPALAAQNTKISGLLGEIDALTRQRFALANGDKADTELDERFNSVYLRFHQASGALEDAAKKIVLKDYAESRRFFIAINFAVIFITLTVSTALWRLAARKNRAEDELHHAHDELETRIARRTEELRLANERLGHELAARQRIEEEAGRQAHLAALGELAAGVAHEINNPVNGIINCAEMIMNKSGEKSQGYELSKRIIKEGNRIAYIATSLLSFARESADGKTPTHIGEMLADVLALTETQMQRNGITLELDIPDESPRVQALPQQIEQVFLNIINNARDALNQRYPENHAGKILRIAAEKTTDSDGRSFMRISFKDQGAGIPAHLLGRIREPFFSTKPRGKGTGLGLSISHGIINKHGGRLAINSKEGEFTEVAVELPLIERNDPA